MFRNCPHLPRNNVRLHTHQEIEGTCHMWAFHRDTHFVGNLPMFHSSMVLCLRVDVPDNVALGYHRRICQVRCSPSHSSGKSGNLPHVCQVREEVETVWVCNSAHPPRSNGRLRIRQEEQGTCHTWAFQRDTHFVGNLPMFHSSMVLRLREDVPCNVALGTHKHICQARGEVET